MYLPQCKAFTKNQGFICCGRRSDTAWYQHFWLIDALIFLPALYNTIQNNLSNISGGSPLLRLVLLRKPNPFELSLHSRHIFRTMGLEHSKTSLHSLLLILQLASGDYSIPENTCICRIGSLCTLNKIPNFIKLYFRVLLMLCGVLAHMVQWLPRWIPVPQSLDLSPINWKCWIWLRKASLQQFCVTSCPTLDTSVNFFFLNPVCHKILFGF